VAVTVALLVRVPVARGSTRTVTLAWAPGSRVPREQLTVVEVLVQVPWLVVAQILRTPYAGFERLAGHWAYWAYWAAGFHPPG